MKKHYILLLIFVLAVMLLFSNCDLLGEQTNITFTVIFETDGGGTVVFQSVVKGGTVVKPDDPVKTGYTFNGWYKDAVFSEIWNFSSDTVLTNLTIYAKWSASDYTINYNLNGGTNHGGNPNTFTIETLPLILQAPTRTGYIFNGWYANPDLTGTAATAIPQGQIGHKAFWAKWIYDSTAIHYVSNRQLVTVPGGTFIQQCSVFNQSFSHTVSSFNLGKYETTYELWYIVREWAISNGYTITSVGNEGSSNNRGDPSTAKYEPVTMVNWRSVIVWLNAYSEMKGLAPVYTYDDTVIRDSSDSTAIENAVADWSTNGYRLPSEGEWQFAASYIDGSTWLPYNHASGDTTSYCWPIDENTSTMFGDYAWYNANTAKTQTVGSKTANQLGIYDMSGNVWEWCWDNSGTLPDTPQTDYRGPDTGHFPILRGGCWGGGSYNILVGRRSNNTRCNEFDSVGFRVAKSSR